MLLKALNAVTTRRLKRASAPLRALAAVVLGLLASACSHALPSIEGVPSAPATRDEPWRPPARAVPAEPTRAERDTVRPAVPLALDQVVELALRNNPQTQQSWAQARAGAATYGAASAAYVPSQ